MIESRPPMTTIDTTRIEKVGSNVVGREPLGPVGEHDAGVSRHESRQREGEELRPHDRRPARSRPDLVVANCDEAPGDPLVAPNADHDHREDENDDREPGERPLGEDLDAEERRPRYQGGSGIRKAGADGPVHERQRHAAWSREWRSA